MNILEINLDFRTNFKYNFVEDSFTLLLKNCLCKFYLSPRCDTSKNTQKGKQNENWKDSVCSNIFRWQWALQWRCSLLNIGKVSRLFKDISPHIFDWKGIAYEYLTVDQTREKSKTFRKHIVGNLQCLQIEIVKFP